MGQHTPIEWCDSTVNPTGFQCCGCELWNPSRGVKLCYAGRWAERIGGVGAFDQPVQLAPGRMAQAAKWSDLRGTNRPAKPWLDGRPRVIFIGDMADTLQAGVPFDYLLKEVIEVVTSPAGRRHVWMWLTKQSARLAEFFRWLDDQGILWPDNLWPGVTITSAQKTWRIAHLVQVPSEHRFISYEPAWEYVDFQPWSEQLDLIIAGGQSGKDSKPFNIDWAVRVAEFCNRNLIYCFIKQLGSNCITDNANLQDWPDGTVLVGQGEGFAAARAAWKHKKGGDWTEWPEQARIRQFPAGTPAVLGS